MMRAEGILHQLDQAAQDLMFPILDNGYIYPADVRLSIDRDTTNWLMIFEMLGAYSPRVSGYDTFQNCLHLFGSDLHRRFGTANEDFLYPVEGCPDNPLFADQYEWFAKDDARCVMLRGKRIQLDLSSDALSAGGITLIEPPRIDPVAVLRSLLPEHRDLLLATDEELAKRNKHKLPLWMRLEEWYHSPGITTGEKPSETDTFQMLADAVSSGAQSKYRPTRPPNTDWRHWPEGGTL